MMIVPKKQEEKIDLYAESSRIALAKMIIRLFQLWNLTTTEQLNLLGLSPKSRSLLSKYGKGEALPATRDVLDRVGYLLAIHKALMLLFPENEDLFRSWIKRRNTAFGGATPLEVILEQGIVGMARVSRYLDFVRGH